MEIMGQWVYCSLLGTGERGELHIDCYILELELELHSAEMGE